LEAFVDRVTGEVRLENNSGAPLDIKGYSITSPDGSLNPASAAFLSDSDPNWIRLSSATGNDLSEAHLTTGTIADGASFTDPHQYPLGISLVIVNGVPTLREGEHVGEPAGRPLRGSAYAPA